MSTCKRVRKLLPDNLTGSDGKFNPSAFISNIKQKLTCMIFVYKAGINSVAWQPIVAETHYLKLLILVGIIFHLYCIFQVVFLVQCYFLFF